MTDDTIPLDRDLSYRYEERPKVAPTDHDAFQPSTEWVNYWDMNPVDHGAYFLRWDGDMWVMHEAFPPSGYHDSDDQHLWSAYYFEPSDVWNDPEDPWTDFTDAMKGILESHRDTHHLPVSEPFLELVDYYVVDLQEYIRGDRGTQVHKDDFWDHARSLGIDPEAERGWAYNGD